MAGTGHDITDSGTVDAGSVGTGAGRPVETDQRASTVADGFHDGDLVVGGAAAALQRAFDDGDLVLYYQPMVGVFDDRITGVEALLRWQHPERGLIGPLEFIGLAEQTGLIAPIGSWVIDQACRQAARWREAFPGRSRLQVSVNISRSSARSVGELMAYPRVHPV